MDTFTANVSAVGGSTTASAIVALLPLITFFVMLLVVKAKAYVSGLTAPRRCHHCGHRSVPHAMEFRPIVCNPRCSLRLVSHRMDRGTSPVVLPSHSR